MARFDVHRVHGVPGFLLDCQTELLSELSSRVVVPLLPPDQGPPAVRRLNPTFEIEGETVMMFTQYISPIATRELGFRLCSLADRDFAIMNALDMLLTGY